MANSPDDSSAPRRILVGRELEGARIDVALARGLDISRAAARRLLAEGGARLAPASRDREDGAPAPEEAFRPLTLSDKGSVLEVGQEFEVAAFRSPSEQRAIAAPDLGLTVLASGEGWMALDKPAGLPVHPLRADERDTVLGFVAAQRPEVHGIGEGGLRSGIVHRLDVDTSGALLVATEQRTWETLRSAFSKHRVEKRYRALVAGELKQAGTQRFALHVAQHRPAKVRVASLGYGPSSPAARDDARTVEQFVQPLEHFENSTLVEVRPKTGFLHQIRATLAHIGHPVLGDATYGDAEVASRAPRQMLHAGYVRFEEYEAISPDPSDFSRALERA